MGLLNFLGGISGGFAAYLFGRLKGRFGVEALFGAAAVFGALAGLALLWAAVAPRRARVVG